VAYAAEWHPILLIFGMNDHQSTTHPTASTGTHTHTRTYVRTMFQRVRQLASKRLVRAPSLIIICVGLLASTCLILFHYAAPDGREGRPVCEKAGNIMVLSTHIIILGTQHRRPNSPSMETVRFRLGCGTRIFEPEHPEHPTTHLKKSGASSQRGIDSLSSARHSRQRGVSMTGWLDIYCQGMRQTPHTYPVHVTRDREE
jgi:hypothetical protein